MPTSKQGSSGPPKKAGAPTKKAAAQRPANTRSSANRKRYAERQASKRQAEIEARRARNVRIGFGSIVLVVVIIAALILVKVAGGGSSGGSNVASPAAGTPVAAATMARLASVPISTLKAASPSQVDGPTAIHDKALTADGKPELLFVGAEFCPICAAERWAMYVALSKFGTFSPEPGQIHSAVRDGDIQTLTFYKTTYTSPYFTFVSREIYTNNPNGNTYTTLESLTPAQTTIWEAHTSQTFPFLDFGGKDELTSAQYDPSLLEGPSFSTIASDVGNNSTTIGTDIDASADLLIQTICNTLTKHKPAAVCSAIGHA